MTAWIPAAFFAAAAACLIAALLVRRHRQRLSRDNAYETAKWGGMT